MALKKRIITRLIILSIIVFGIMNCEEGNPADNSLKKSNNSILGLWYLSEKIIINDDLNNNLDTTTSVYGANDSCYFIMDIRNDLSISYVNYVETWMDTNTYNISEDTIYTEKISYGLPFEIKDEILIVYVFKSNKDIIYKYSRYNSSEVPPDNWPAMSETKPLLLTAFYPDYTEDD